MPYVGNLVDIEVFIAVAFQPGELIVQNLDAFTLSADWGPQYSNSLTENLLKRAILLGLRTNLLFEWGLSFELP